MKALPDGWAYPHRYVLCLHGCVNLLTKSLKMIQNQLLTPQWSLYVQHSGYYKYRTVVTICTVQWSLYVPHSGHYIYRTLVAVCTAQWSLYVTHSGHCMYRIVVTVCTAQWSLYVPHSGHYMYRQFNIHKFYVLPTQLYLCVLCGSQNKQPLFPYTTLTVWFV